MQKALIHAATPQDAACFPYVFIEPEIIHSSSDKSRQTYCTVLYCTAYSDSLLVGGRKMGFFFFSKLWILISNYAWNHFLRSKYLCDDTFWRINLALLLFRADGTARKKSAMTTAAVSRTRATCNATSPSSRPTRSGWRPLTSSGAPPQTSSI